MRSFSTSSPFALRTASRNFVAQTFSNRSSAADELFSSAFDSRCASSSVSKPVMSPATGPQASFSLVSGLAQLDDGQLAVLVLDGEEEVDDANGAVLDDSRERRRDLHP